MLRSSTLQDDSFQSPVVSYPFNITLGAWLNVAVVLRSGDQQLKQVVPDCWATPYANSSANPKYPIITDRYVLMSYFISINVGWLYMYMYADDKIWVSNHRYEKVKGFLICYILRNSDRIDLKSFLL